MITLYLISTGMLRSPVLYLSDYLERHRRLYYDNLAGVHDANRLDRWLRFFLVGIIETARDGVRTFDGILRLRETVNDRVTTLGNRATDAQLVVQSLYARPVISISETAAVINKSEVTASRLLGQLLAANILRPRPKPGKGKLFESGEYLDLFR